MDDVDYYPDAYLNRLAHEGVNGLWLSVEWKDISKTSFREPSPDMERRLAKLAGPSRNAPATESRCGSTPTSRRASIRRTTPC